MPYDGTGPEVRITGPSGGFGFTNGRDPFDVIITFSETVTGFELDDVKSSNGSASNIRPLSSFSGKVSYVVTITPDHGGEVRLIVLPGAVQDLAGNANEGRVVTRVPYDGSKPATRIITTSRYITTLNPFDVTITFSEAVRGRLQENDIDVGNGHVVGLVSRIAPGLVRPGLERVPSASYVARIRPTAGLASGSVITIDVGAGKVRDFGGNENTAAPQARVTYDPDPPRPSITAPDHITTLEPFAATVTFSEPVVSMNEWFLNVDKGRATNPRQTATRGVYFFRITPASDLKSGDRITLVVPANSVTDRAGNGNLADPQATVIYDPTLPVINTDNVTVPTDPGLATAVVDLSGRAWATDAVDGVFSLEDLTITSSPTAGLTSGSAFPLGTTTMTVTARDAAGNLGTGSFTITVEDREPPVVSVPENITVRAPPGQNQVSVSYPMPTAADNVGVTAGPTVANAAHASGQTFPVGTTTVTWTATDAAGNVGSATFDVIVLGPAGVTVTAGADLMTAEYGSTVTFTVVLDSQPTATVTINLTSSDTTEGTVSPAVLTFPLDIWNTPQTVSVTSVDDDLADGDQAYTIITAAAVSTDDDYNGAAVADVSVINNDDETPGLTVTPSAISTSETGTSADFTVALTEQPTGDVTVAITGLDASEGSLSETILTFPANDWDDAKTVTVTGVNDEITDGPQTYTLTATATGGGYSNVTAPTTGSVAVTNSDDDAAVATSTITADPTSIVADGSSTSTITVQLKDTNGNNLTASGGTVTLATTACTLSQVSDGGDGSYTATLTSATTVGTATVTGLLGNSAISDDADVRFIAGAVDLAEATITADPTSIVADGSSTSTITVQLKDANGNNLTASGGTVTLATTAGTLSQVSDGGDGSYTATLTSATQVGTATVTGLLGNSAISDDADVRFIAGAVDLAEATITADPTSIVADGSSTSTITVQLKDANGNNLTASGGTVTLATTAGTLSQVSDGGDGSYTATLTSATQVGTATVTGLLGNSAISDDADVRFIAGAVDLAEATITADPTSIVADGSSTSTITVQLKDANGNNLTASGGTVTLATTAGTLSQVSDGGDGSYTATLTSATQVGTATVTGLLGNSAISDDADVRFIAGAVDLAEATITADPTSIVADGSSTSTITVQLKDANGNNLTASGGTVTLATTAGTLSQVSDGGDGSYTATLTSATQVGTATVTGLLGNSAISDDADVRFIAGAVDLAEATITADPTSIVADGSSTSTITVQLKDANGNNLTASGGTVTLATTAGTLSQVSDGGDGSYTATLTSATQVGTATVTGLLGNSAISDDADVRFIAGAVDLAEATITADPTSIVADGSSTSTITVQLKDANGNNLTASGGTVTLATTAGTLSQVSDGGDGSYTATLTSATQVGTATVTGLLGNSAISNDADVRFIAGAVDLAEATITADPTSIVADGSSTSTITVQLKDANGNNLTASGGTVTLATTAGTLSQVSDGGDGSYTATLTSATQVGTATVTGRLNNTAISDTAQVAFTAAAGVTVTPVAGLLTTEAGGTATFTVVLDSQPTADVTIRLTSSDTTEGTVSTAQLTFTAGNWDKPQPVTVTGVNDDVADGNQVYTIVTAAAVSSDTGYNGVDPADVSVTNTDDESDEVTGGVTVTPVAGLTTTEDGDTARFTVVLNSQPTANVTIALRSSDTGEGTVSPASLVFTADNWATAQTVTVTGVNDDIVDGDQAYTIITAAAVSTDAGYSGVITTDVSVTNEDDDSAGVTVLERALTVAENGGTDTYTVVLTSQPTGNVTVTPSSSDTSAATVSGAIIFTADNWNTPQTVTVTGVNDDIDNNPDRTATISHTITGSGHDIVTVADVTVTVIDDDVAAVSVAPVEGLVTTEAGGTDTFTVVLDSQPTSSVTIGLTSSDTTEGTVSTAQLTFTADNWDTQQTVTVTGVDDDVTDGDVPYTIETTASSADALYNGIAVADVSVINEDDDKTGSVTFVVNSPDAGEVRFQSATGVLNVTVMVSGGTSRSDVISVPVGAHEVSYQLPTGFSATSASCSPAMNPDKTGNIVNMRERRISLSIMPGAEIECTLSIEDAATRTTKEIVDFMEERAWLIMSHRSDRHRRIARLKDERVGASPKVQGHRGRFSSPLSLAMEGKEGDEKIQLRFSCTQSSPDGGQGHGAAGNACGSNDWWLESTLGRYTRGEAKGTYAVTHVGVDRLVGKNVLVGLAVQHDRVVRERKGERPGATFRADGWMAGPYVTWRLHDGIYFDAGISAGTATNRIAMTDGGASGTFNSQRFSGYATLVGDFDHGRWNIRPQLGFSWYQETAKAWTGTGVDGHGVEIPDVHVRTGDLEAGVRFTHKMPDDVSSQYFEIDGILALAGNTNKDNRLRLRSGLTAAMPFGGVVDAGISFDGLGDDDWEAYGLKLGYSVAPYWLPGTIDAGLSFNGSGVEEFDFEGLSLDFRSDPDPWIGGIFTAGFSFEDAEGETDTGEGSGSGRDTMSIRLGYKGKF